MPRRAFPFALVVALLLPSLHATASDGGVFGVGAFSVDAAGRARGANLGLVVAEATGRLADVTSFAQGRTVLSGFSVDGFEPVSKLAGVGSSSLGLRGERAVLTLGDSVHTPIVLGALGDVDATADLAAGVAAEVAGDGRRADLVGPDGPLGSFFVLGPGSLASDGGRVDATLRKGATLAYRGLAPGGDPAFEAEVVDRAASRPLAEVVSEHVGSRAEFATVVYAAKGSVAAGPVDGGVVATTSGVLAVAFDLAYETLPARRVGDVVVFVDGAPVPALVATAADRAAVLVDLADDGAHRVVVAASGHGRTERQALAESRSRGEASVEGSFTLHGDRAAGFFAAFRVDRGAAAVEDLTLVRTGVQAIASLDLTGDGPARVTPQGDRVVLEAGTSRVTVVDDPYATVVVDALRAAQAVVALGEGVRVAAAPGPTATVVGPDGFAGTFFVVMRDGTPTAASGLAETAPGILVASLEQDARLVFRSEPAGPDADLAEALGAAEIDAQVVAGFAEGRPAARAVAYADGASVGVAAATGGRLELDFAGSAFALDARGGVLAAKDARDLAVTVDGEPATPASDLPAALGSPGPAYAVATFANGDARVVVRTGAQRTCGSVGAWAAACGGPARVVVESRLVQEARDAAESDGFGAFRVFGDGTVVGDFVSLRAEAGVVSDFTLLASSARVFRSVAAGDSSFGRATGLDATHLVLANDEAEVQASDVTSGYLKVVAKRATRVGFDLDPSVTPFRLGANVVALQRDGAAFASMILTGAEGRAAAGSAFELVDGGVVARLDRGAQAIFRTHVGIETELDDAERALVDLAIARGHVAGQVMVRTTEALAADRTATSAVAIANYDDVQILSAATSDRVEVTVSSTTSSGRTLIVSLDPRTVPGMASGLAEILVDGEEAEHASSYEDVLDPTDDGGEPEYFVLAGDHGTQVLVSIPHFSTRSVTLRERGAFAGPPVFMYATIFLSVLVAAETVFLARRRKK